MIQNKDTAIKLAEFLLQIKAIVLNPENPFTWASGIKSPIYCDNRKILSYPKIRNFVRQELSKCISESYGKPDVIAGVATGAIAIGVLVAQEMGLPFVYVRPEPKGHGLQNQIEGVLENGQSVVIVEDLISTGKSSLAAYDAIKASGANPKGMVSIFTYGLSESTESFKSKKCKLNALADYDVLIQVAQDKNYISPSNVKLLKEWKKNPQHWLNQ
jgi:orotate phosphoribosyltransferase